MDLTFLTKNSSKLVRQCAQYGRTKMSWGQAWEKFKEQVSDILSTPFTRKDNLMKTIMDQHPSLQLTLKKNLSTRQNEANNARPNAVNKNEERGR